MTVVTDYTERAQQNTLCSAPLTRYRFAHWLCDIVKNFMSDPEHIRDERLRGLLWPQDGVEPDECRAVFKVGLPMSPDSRKAGVTPAILVSAGQQQYPVNSINAGIGASYPESGTRVMYEGTAVRQVTGKIAVVTESLDGTLLLCDILEDYLVTNTAGLVLDGMVQSLKVEGSSEPVMIKAGEAGNAKELFQTVVSLTAIGGLSWEADTQGPVFRGLDNVSATL